METAPEDARPVPGQTAERLMRSFAGIVAGTILFLLAVPCLLLAGWGLVFNVPTVSVVAFTAAWILLPLFNRIKAIRVLKFAVSFVLIPATLALSPFMIGEVDRQVEALSRKNRHDLSAFDLRDRLGIYGLNIVMGAVGYPLYPEASKETLLMMIEPGPQARRVFNSDFAIGSKRIRAQLQACRERLSRGDTAAVQMRIVWDKSEYRLTEPEARYALALNQTWLWLSPRRTRRGWFIDVRHDVGIEYPDSAYVTLVSRPRLRMEEGLFWVLQNCGWLHPYTAEWRFLVFSDDKRLR